MRRGEVWWAEFGERRPVVLLSDEEPSGFRAMQVVAPADTDISGLGTEVAVGLRQAEDVATRWPPRLPLVLILAAAAATAPQSGTIGWKDEQHGDGAAPRRFRTVDGC